MSTETITMPLIVSDEEILQAIHDLKIAYVRDFFESPKYLIIGRSQYRDLRNACESWVYNPRLGPSDKENYDGMEIIQVLKDSFLSVGK